MKMKPNNLILITLFVFQIFLISFSQFSDRVEVKIPSLYNINAGQTVRIPIEIKNLDYNEVKVFLYVFPPYYEGISAYFDVNNVVLSPNSEASVNLVVSAPTEAKSAIITYQIFVEYNNIKKTYKMELNVIGGKGEIKVTNFGINKNRFDPDESLIAFVEYQNSKNIVTFVRAKMEISRENEIIKTEEKTVNILPFSKASLNFSYLFSYFDRPGKYYINIYSYDENKNTISKLSFEVFLNEINNVEKRVDKQFSIFQYRVSVEIENVGNVIQKIRLEEEFPIILKSFVVFEGMNPKIENNKAIWEVDLKPKEKIVFSYSIIYLPILLLASILVVAFLVFLFFYLLKPRSLKKYEKFEDVYKIKIFIKNSSRKRMKNIEISDFVPSLFSIVEFETLKPQVKKSKDGYDLVWKIRELKPKEELIISYKIKPLIEIIGEIKLPKPKIKYVLK
ncbi:MAG: hypothetical protein QXT38_00600 [Candidatus Aenigmatarchaeota archaeon]